MHHRERPPSVSQSATAALGVLRGLSFWLAIGLPASYLPVLAITPEGHTGTVLMGLIAVNFVCLLVGHEHTP